MVCSKHAVFIPVYKLIKQNYSNIKTTLHNWQKANEHGAFFIKINDIIKVTELLIISI